MIYRALTGAILFIILTIAVLVITGAENEGWAFVIIALCFAPVAAWVRNGWRG